MLAVVLPKKLNVRARPNVQSACIGQLVVGDVLTLLAHHGGWGEISYAGRPGFVSLEYLDTQSTPMSQTGRVKVNLLNVRAQPNIESPVIARVVKGQALSLLSVGPTWCQVAMADGVGHVARQYLQISAVLARQSGEVLASKLNVRALAQVGSTVIGQLTRGTAIPLIARTGDWYQIQFNQGTGYVAARYIRQQASAQIKVEPTGQTSKAAPLTMPRDAIGRKLASCWNRFAKVLQQEGKSKGIAPEVCAAVLAVESSGQGFSQGHQGRMIIRFENHKFWQFWGKQHPQVFRRHFRFQSGKAWLAHQWRASEEGPWEDFHGAQASEWQVLMFARQLNEDAALNAISMGAAQIMGFHWQRLGYTSVKHMFDAFCRSEDAQISGFFDFLSPRMIQSLQRGEYEEFARLYNGPGQAKQYGRWISEHTQRIQELLA